MLTKKSSPLASKSFQSGTKTNPVSEQSNTFNESSIIKSLDDIRTSTTTVNIKEPDVVRALEEEKSSSFSESSLNIVDRNSNRGQNSADFVELMRPTQQSTTSEMFNLYTSKKSDLVSFRSFMSSTMIMNQSMNPEDEQRRSTSYAPRTANEEEMRQESDGYNFTDKDKAWENPSQILVNFLTFDGSVVSDKRQSPQDDDKPIASTTTGTTNNLQYSTDEQPSRSNPNNPTPSMHPLVVYNSSNQDNNERKNYVETSEENGTVRVYFDKNSLKFGIYMICLCHAISFGISAMIYFFIYMSNLHWKISLLLRFGIVMAAAVKMTQFLTLFYGAYKENPLALYFASVIGWFVFLTHEVVGIMGFLFFISISKLTYNFLIAAYFACLVLFETFTFCRNSLIINIYRQVLMNHPIKEEALLLALCCTTCNIVWYIHANRHNRQDRMSSAQT